MISSGMKRGLAASAVSALAVAGLPLLASSASANPMVDQIAPNAVVLYTPDNLGAASIKNDGQNATVHLLANAGSDATQVRFEYGTNPAGPFTAIATVSRSNGVFSTEWTPPTSVYNLPVHVRAVAIDNTNNDATVADNVATVTSNQDAIDISNAAGSAIGVFHQPYTTTDANRTAAKNKDLGAVSATTSDVATDPAVKFSTPYNASSMDEDVVGTPANGSRSVSGPADFTGYTWSTSTAADQAIVEANVGAAAGGSDAEAVTVYKQTITTVTAAAASPTVQGTNPTKATVTVKDQNGNPVVGAEVVREDTNEIQYTNSKGEAVFSGLTGTTTGTAYKFYVNTTDTYAYQNGTDFERSVTVTSYTAAAASITASSADGAAFDFDENDGDDIQALVKDQNGKGMANQVVRYQWTVTPFAATAGYPKALPEGSAVTDGDGKANIAFPTATPAGTYVLHTYINQDGTPGQQSGDLGGTDLTVKAGQAEVKWADDTKAQAAAGSTKTFTGKLVLEDGTGLPGRDMSVNLAQTNDANGDGTTGDNGDAIMAAQSAQPAGTTRLSATSAKTTTGTDGGFAVALTDPPVTAPATPSNELGDKLTAATTNTTDIGNAGASADLTVDWLKSMAPAAVGDIVVGALQNLIDGKATPGRPVDLDITVKNADGITLTDYPVDISVDHGFLSSDYEGNGNKLTPDPAPAQDGLFGEWKSEGVKQTLTTDDSGNTGEVVAIEKDAAFDTSQTVTTTVTIKAGDVTKTVPVVFTSESPLNGGDVKVERAAQQSVTILPKAPTAESVNYNVFTTDQFGNLVKGETVNLTDNLSGADVNGAENNGTATSQLKNESAALVLDSGVAGDQTVTGKWTTDTNTWNDSVPATPAFDAARKTVTDGKTFSDDGETVNWYVIDYAHSTYTMSHDTAGDVKVGTTVLETYKAVDQMGEPIRNATVKFFRSGPDSYQDGDFNSAATTNEAGEASYVFSGAKAGTATVQGILLWRDAAGDHIVPESRATDQVTFVGDAVVSPEVKLQGSDNGAKADKLKVNAINAASGAVVKLFKVTKSGALKLVGTSTLNQYGNHKFKVADENGNKKTAYVAKVAKTNKTTKGQAGKSVR